jgi:aquaporin Z
VNKQVLSYLAETMGTALLVFVGTGAIALDESTGAVTHLGISLAFGLIVTLMILVFGKASGAHLNPAVSVALWLAGKLELRKLPGYLMAQLLGALAASSAVRLLFPTSEALGSTLPSGSVWTSFLLELGMTFALMFLIISLVTGLKRLRPFAAPLIGGVVFLEAFFGGPISGASMNPARSIGPALVSGHIEHLWVYIAAPLLGAAFAILLCTATHTKPCCEGSVLCKKP